MCWAEETTGGRAADAVRLLSLALNDPMEHGARKCETLLSAEWERERPGAGAGAGAGA